MPSAESVQRVAGATALVSSLFAISNLLMLFGDFEDVYAAHPGTTDHAVLSEWFALVQQAIENGTASPRDVELFANMMQHTFTFMLAGSIGAVSAAVWLGATLAKGARQ